jgi:hypothetical protein
MLEGSHIEQSWARTAPSGTELCESFQRWLVGGKRLWLPVPRGRPGEFVRTKLGGKVVGLASQHDAAVRLAYHQRPGVRVCVPASECLIRGPYLGTPGHISASPSSSRVSGAGEVDKVRNGVSRGVRRV